MSVDLERIGVIDQLSEDQKTAFLLGTLYHEAYFLQKEKLFGKALSENEEFIIKETKKCILKLNIGFNNIFLTEGV